MRHASCLKVRMNIASHSMPCHEPVSMRRFSGRQRYKCLIVSFAVLRQRFLVARNGALEVSHNAHQIIERVSPWQ
jgi:hypothetical protein